MKNLARFSAVLLVTIITGSVCFGATIYVDQSGGGDYTTIAAGINAANPEDTIKVGPGNYSVTVSINKSIKLVGSGPKYTVINASLNGIEVNNLITAEIRGFTITAGDNGIVLNNSSSTIIENNVITGCGGNAIHHQNNHNSTSNAISSTIRNNTIVNNSGDGIMLRSGASNYGSARISGNIIALNGGDNIYLVPE